MSEIPKTYESQSVEDKWYQFWLDQECFVADAQSKNPAYSIVIPPPNITGVLHMGHVLNNTIQDILARKARMDGKEVLWLPGTDHASIATHMVLERKLKKEEGITRYDLGREKFIERAWEWREKHGGIIISQLKKLGCSCDWSRLRFTMDDAYSSCVQSVFIELYKKGLVYRGKRMVNWCPATQTALSDEEVVMKEQKGSLYYFKVEVDMASTTVPVADSGVAPESSLRAGAPIGAMPIGAGETPAPPEEKIFLTIATTRPETIPGDTAVAVNPKDPRYAKFIGKHVIRPLPAELPREQKLIPIIGDEHVEFEFGTGVLKVTPAHDKADFEIGQRHNLPQIDIMHPNGHMNELAGKDLNGLDRVKAREAATEKLAELGALEKEEPYTNNVGFSERADVPIEPRLSEQWFLKYPSADKARNCVELGSATVPVADSGVAPESLSNQFHSAGEASGATPDAARETRALPEKMQFHPQRWAKVYDHWMGGLQDWCISRQLWWGHRIPVWYSEGWKKLRHVMVIVTMRGDELAGANVKELRKSAFAFATTRGIIGQDFLNLDTRQSITVHKASLEHAFSNFGVANVKLVPALPDLLRHAVRVSVEPHVPASDDVKAVETYFAALQLGDQFFRVKFRVKVFAPNFRLYDHQSVLLWKANEPDGNKSPEAHAPKSETSRPASGSRITLADLVSNVNADPAFTRCQIESPGQGWEQDPDVLDTWFSSWLWPFATMGWPEQTVTLKKFYPTTDLVTGPDIIFFWVARMIMAGYEFMGEMPFRNVYFTGIIRDKQHVKMSKSLGNSPDPLDLIGKYGADALRFGTMRSAPLGQDILFDEQNVELGRNFCNKLWNACRFRQMHGGEVQGEINPQLLTPDDKWILLKLDAAIREMDTAFAEYKFSDATATLYRFFWSEYCDWYVETTKAALSGSSRGNEAQIEKAERGTGNAEMDQSLLPSAATEARKANTLAVIDFVLSHTLRLFHPFLPFITEELWHGMGYADDMPEKQGGQTIMFAPWPKPLDDDFKEHYGLNDAGEKLADAKYELVSLGRNLRREFNIQANKKIKFIFKPAGKLSALDAEVITLLLNAESAEVATAVTPPKGTPMVANAFGELFLPLEGLVDVEAEKNRLKKEQAKIATEIAKVQQKLANPNFVQKVPPQVLAEHQRRLADWQGKLARVKSALAALEN